MNAEPSPSKVFRNRDTLVTPPRPVLFLREFIPGAPGVNFPYYWLVPTKGGTMEILLSVLVFAVGMTLIGWSVIKGYGA